MFGLKLEGLPPSEQQGFTLALKNLLFARSLVPSAAQVMENWFLAITKHGATLSIERTYRQ